MTAYENLSLYIYGSIANGDTATFQAILAPVLPYLTNVGIDPTTAGKAQVLTAYGLQQADFYTNTVPLPSQVTAMKQYAASWAAQIPAGQAVPVALTAPGTAPAGTTPPVASTPKLQFLTPNGTVIGAPYTFIITGAPANAAIGSTENGGALYTWPTKADAGGNWTLAGNFGTPTVSQYTQGWYVNGVLIQTLVFSITAPGAPLVAVIGTPPLTTTPVAPTTTPTTTPTTPPTSTPTFTPQPLPGKENLVATALAAGLTSGTGGYCDLFPDDTFCGGYGNYGGLNPPFEGGSTTIVDTGVTGSDVTNAINSALSGLWAAAVGAIDAVVAGAINGIQKAITALGNSLLSAWQILSRLGGLLLNFLRTLWTAVVKLIVTALQQLQTLIKDLYDRVLKPALQALHSIRQKIIDIYTRVVRPLIIVIQDVRQVLAVLKLFHIGFADKLDKTLADLEQRISAPLLLLLRYTNQVANWINLISTAGYLLQKPIFMGSLNAYKGSTFNLLANSVNKTPSPAAAAALQTAGTIPPAQQTASDFAQYAASGSGAMADSINAQIAAFKSYTSQGLSG